MKIWNFFCTFSIPLVIYRKNIIFMTNNIKKKLLTCQKMRHLNFKDKNTFKMYIKITIAPGRKVKHNKQAWPKIICFLIFEHDGPSQAVILT